MPAPIAPALPPLPAGLPAGDRGAVLPVSLLVGSVRLLLERHIGLVWVSGEVSNFTRAASGHCYFNLKDAGAQVRCVFFRHKAQLAGVALKDGVQLEVRATASIYEARGEFQLNVETARLAGAGALYEKYARLKARLDAAGWFADDRKRPLPPYPRALGIVTSTRAAALSDLLATLRRRRRAPRPASRPPRRQARSVAAVSSATPATRSLDKSHPGGALSTTAAIDGFLMVRCARGPRPLGRCPARLPQVIEKQ